MSTATPSSAAPHSAADLRRLARDLDGLIAAYEAAPDTPIGGTGEYWDWSAPQGRAACAAAISVHLREMASRAANLVESHRRPEEVR